MGNLAFALSVGLVQAILCCALGDDLKQSHPSMKRSESF